MNKLQPPLIDALLSSGINADSVTIQLVIGNSVRRQMYPLEIEPELVPSIVLALNQNLAEAKRIWPGKVKPTAAVLVAQGISHAINGDGSITLTFTPEDGSQLAVKLNARNITETAKTFGALAETLSGCKDA